MADRNLVIRMSVEERAVVSKALRAYSEEFFRVAEQSGTTFVRESLEVIARDASAIRDMFDAALTRVELNDVVRRELTNYAIKAVRAATTMGLKEAKDYVDNYTEDPLYGASKF